MKCSREHKTFERTFTWHLRALDGVHCGDIYLYMFQIQSCPNTSKQMTFHDRVSYVSKFGHVITHISLRLKRKESDPSCFCIFCTLSRFTEVNFFFSEKKRTLSCPENPISCYNISITPEMQTCPTVQQFVAMEMERGQVYGAALHQNKIQGHKKDTLTLGSDSLASGTFVHSLYCKTYIRTFSAFYLKTQQVADDKGWTMWPHLSVALPSSQEMVYKLKCYKLQPVYRCLHKKWEHIIGYMFPVLQIYLHSIAIYHSPQCFC